FIHARSAGSGDDDHGRAFGSSIFNRARNSLTNDRAHRRSEKVEIHDRDGDLISVKNSVSADHRVEEAGAFLIFFEAIFVAGHSLKTQNVDGSQVGIHFYESVRIEQILDALLGRLCKVIIAARTNALVLR